MCKMCQKSVVVVMLVWSLLGMIHPVSAQPTVTPILIPDVRTIYVGLIPKEITLIARVDREVQFEWTLDGPGTLDGDLTSREIVYLPPDKLGADNGRATIKINVTDFRGETASEAVAFSLITPPVTPGPTPTAPAPEPTAETLQSANSPAEAREESLSAVPTAEEIVPEPSLENPEDGTLYAVIIGIKRYADEQFSEIPFAEHDAQEFYDMLSDEQYGIMSQERTKLLLGQEATSRNIKHALGKWLHQNVTPEDTVIVYYAGHGVFEEDAFYWVPYEADSQDLYSTALSRDDLLDMFKRIHTQNLITFVDSRNPSALKEADNETPPLQQEIPWDIFAGEGRILMSATDGRTPSLDLSEQQHGLFAASLLEAFKGGADQNADSTLTVEEIWEYIQGKIAETSGKMGSRQEVKLQGEPEKFPGTFKVIAAQEQAEDPPENHKERIIKIYRAGDISAEQFTKALNLLETGGKDQILEDFLAGELALEIFKKVF